MSNATRPPAWLWPMRLPSARSAQLVKALRIVGDQVGSAWRWLLLGVGLGALPVLVELLTKLPLSRCTSAMLLTPFFLAAVVRDSQKRGLALVAAVFASHSALVIAVSAVDARHLATLFPAGADYWTTSRHWIATGESAEYQPSYWLPAQAQLLAATAILTYTSFGMIPFWQGLYEVDLMNAYVGQLLVHSRNPWLALAVGWHPWSLCRAAGYLFVTFEIASWSLSRLTGVALSTPSRRRQRHGRYQEPYELSEQERAEYERLKAQQEQPQGGGGMSGQAMGWIIFILIFGVGNLILYLTTGIFLIPIPRR